MDEQSWVKRYKSMNVKGAAPKHGPRKMLDWTLQSDFKSKNLTSEPGTPPLGCETRTVFCVEHSILRGPSAIGV